MADDSDDSCSTQYNKVPTHILVQKQMQDLIALQKSRVAKLESDLTAQNETLSNSYISKDQYETELGRLQEEKVEHAETRLRLHEVSEKLEMACEQVLQLKQRLEAEKKAHEKTRSTMKNKNIQETAKTVKLQSKCTEISKQCEKQEEILTAKNQEIQHLEEKVRVQEEIYRKEMSEADIDRKQQRYIAKMMEEQDRKKGKTLPQAVPKTKFSKR